MRQNAALSILVVGLGLLVGPGSVLAQRPLGIDVSNWQRSIDWTSVQSSGVAFAWAKASEGTTFTDPYFTNNAVSAKANGILLGAYHFAHPEEALGTAGADAEAAYFWSIISDYTVADGLTLMPVLDYETDPGSNYTTATSSQWANRWCQDIVDYGRAKGVALTPVIYCSYQFATNWLDSTVTQWPLWRPSGSGGNPQTGAPGNTSPWTTWAAWQYGHTPIPGITTGDADVDVFNGTWTTLVSTLVVSSNSTVLPGSWTLESGGNGHFYEAVAAPSGITWSDASIIAASRGGYLATITSSNENQFVFSLVSQQTNLWFLSDKWYGPWLGGLQAPGSREPAGGWGWVTGEPLIYTNWAPGQPNDNQTNIYGNENRMQFVGVTNLAGMWNDINQSNVKFIRSFIIEYPGAPTLQLQMVGDQSVEIALPTQNNWLYQMQRRSDLDTGAWGNWGAPIMGDGSTNHIDDAIPSGQSRQFYRAVITLP